MRTAHGRLGTLTWPTLLIMFSWSVPSAFAGGGISDLWTGLESINGGNAPITCGSCLYAGWGGGATKGTAYSSGGEVDAASVSSNTTAYGKITGKPLVSEEDLTANASGDGYNAVATVGAATIAGGSSKGWGSSVTVWSTVDVQSSTPVEGTTTAETISFAKNGGSLSLGESTAEATVTINGKTYVVAKELAMAFTRGTQSGGTSWIEVEGTIAGPGGGFTTTQVVSSKATSR